MVDVPDDLAELLMLWWLAERGAELAQLGMPRECPSTRGYRSGGHWDAENGVDEARGRSVIVRAVAKAVEALPNAQRAAAHVMTRNLVTGAAVWVSSRLPTEPAARQRVFDQAIDSLMRTLGLTAAREVA